MKIIKKGNKPKFPKWKCIQECGRCGSVLEVSKKDVIGYYYSSYYDRWSTTGNHYVCPVCKNSNPLNPIVSEELMNHLNTYHK